VSDNPQLLTVRDVAKRLQVCERSIWQYSQRGIIPQPVRLGGRRLWLPAPLAEALAKLHAQAQRADSGQEGQP